MTTIYYYVDESFSKADEYWHCNIGGALIENSRVVDTEIAIETAIYESARTKGFPYALGVFKYTDFFRNTSDDYQFEMCSSLADILANKGVRLLISHAKIHEDKVGLLLPPFDTAQKAIQYLCLSTSTTICLHWPRRISSR